MQKTFDVPELTLIGQASEIVMGTVLGGDDFPCKSPIDFEFEHDSL